MIKHIVMFKLKNNANGQSKEANAVELKKLLEQLNGKIDGLLSLEVGLPLTSDIPNYSNADAILYSELENAQALENYYPHPEHVKVLPFVKSVISERRVVDYEI
ncbi:MAG: hypothetical protein A6F72_00045 [Cycloclasticus sp. symbiont of Poecilosclerida sp. N]|nr:MAG: hypothetical protein A6F72_00045 [Cycloclasticus sp. symbiont of Poecilosclerida sp. N]